MKVAGEEPIDLSRRRLTLSFALIARLTGFRLHLSIFVLQVVADSPLVKYGFPTLWMKKVQIGAQCHTRPLAFRLLPLWTDRFLSPRDAGTSGT